MPVALKFYDSINSFLCMKNIVGLFTFSNWVIVGGIGILQSDGEQDSRPLLAKISSWLSYLLLLEY